MPTYEYACRSCEERIEVVQSFSDEALTVCEACGGELRKVFSAAGLIFKGSGWHIKDYSSSAKSGSSSASPAAKDASTKDAPAKDATSQSGGTSGGTSTSSSSSGGTSGGTSGGGSTGD